MNEQGLRVGAFPGLEPRLLGNAEDNREDYSAYRRRGGYARGVAADALIAAVSTSGLRGRGGAGFPTGLKLESVRDKPGPRYAVANGEEGEPASIKDRWLLRNRPHLVLDGLLRAADAVGADRAYVFVSDSKVAESVADALSELEHITPPVEMVQTPAAYVAGEETAVVRRINGGPALPTDKPPRPFESGVCGRPTLVANVETLANLPAIATVGPDAFRAIGQPTSPGTFLSTISGACDRPGLYELPLGVELGHALATVSGLRPSPRGFLMGGFFGGLLGPHALSTPLAYDDLRAVGSGLGCGAVIVLGCEDCPVAAALDVMSYFARENSKQCGSCIRGTPAMRDALHRLADGSATREDVDRLRGWSTSLRGRGACALLDGAADLVGSLLREFPEDVEEHLSGSCVVCDKQVRLQLTASRFALRYD